MNTTSDRPPRMEVLAESIPAELRDQRRWVVWRWEWKAEKQKWDKPPLQVDGRKAKSNDPSTWCTFAEVMAVVDDYDGVGFMLRDSGVVGVDLDDCRDPVTGVIGEPHRSVIHTLNTYAEVSPSGTGVKLLAHATLPEKCSHANHDEGFEVYDKQYFTLTGNRVPDTPPTIEQRQQAVEWVVTTFVDGRRHGSNGHVGRNLDGVWVEPPDKVATARSALAGLSRSRADGYWDWLKVGMALHSVGDDRLLTDWDEWSRQSSKWSEGVCKEKWDTFSGNGVSLGTLIFWAMQDGWKPSRNGKQMASTTAANQDSDSSTTKKYIANCTSLGEGKKAVTIPMMLADIITMATDVTGNWPRRVGDGLFIPSGDDVAFLKSEAALFSYYHQRAIVNWTRGARYVTKAEMFATLQRTATAYDAVELLPHEPPLPRHFYTCGFNAGDGRHLRELVDRFAPATDIDRDLILAAFVTPGWGGPAGTRPAFCITSDHGRGIGKTTLAETVGHVWGGVLSFSHREDIGKIKTRLLTPDALTRRVALLDNVKSLKFSWSELEAMVTCTTIGGHRMYVGEGTRPNTLTWFVTLNGASLSTDMAQRSVIIKLDRPTRSGSWSDDTRAYVEAHRPAIIADVVWFLRSEAITLERFSRWSNWERDVLARLPEPADAQRVIEERQADTDVEGEEAATIEDYFAERLRSLRYRDDEWVFVPSGVATQWYNLAQNDKLTVSQVTRLMKQMVTEGRLKRLRAHRTDDGRGFLWAPSGAASGFAADLYERLAGCWK